MDKLIESLDEHFNYVSHHYEDGRLIVRVESNEAYPQCPYCGTSSRRVHSVCERKLQDLPVMDCKATIVLQKRKMYCDNSDCRYTTFSERFNAVRPYARKTARLCDRIVDASLGTSAVEAAEVMCAGVCDISRQTIVRLQKEAAAETINSGHSGVRVVCIDDFALKKRHHYGTCLCDAETHQIIDMIPSHTGEDVAEWLRSFAEIDTVVRDGSRTYRNAVEKAHPGCSQIGDRFHILKNVLDAANKVILRLPPVIVLEAEPLQGAAAEPSTLSETQWDPGDDPCKEATTMGCGAPAETALSESELNRLERASAVREMYLAGMNYSEIARETGFDRKTVRRYCAEGYQPHHGARGIPKYGRHACWRKRIETLLKKSVRLKGTEIFEILRTEGYTGSLGTVHRYIQSIRGSSPRRQDPKKKVHRADLSRQLYKKPEAKDVVQPELMEQVQILYPELTAIYNSVRTFRELLRSGDASRLDEWLVTTEKLGCESLTGAVHGLRQDLNAVRNAVCSPLSNGIAEGNNTKIKMMMRTGYGRCGFETLKARILLRDRRRQQLRRMA